MDIPRRLLGTLAAMRHDRGTEPGERLHDATKAAPHAVDLLSVAEVVSAGTYAASFSMMVHGSPFPRTGRGKDAKAGFLHRIATGACRWFSAALTPKTNRLHHDHFHLDNGPYKNASRKASYRPHLLFRKAGLG